MVNEINKANFLKNIKILDNDIFNLNNSLFNSFKDENFSSFSQLKSYKTVLLESVGKFKCVYYKSYNDIYELKIEINDLIVFVSSNDISFKVGTFSFIKNNDQDIEYFKPLFVELYNFEFDADVPDIETMFLIMAMKNI